MASLELGKNDSSSSLELGKDDSSTLLKLDNKLRYQETLVSILMKAIEDSDISIDILSTLVKVCVKMAKIKAVRNLEIFLNRNLSDLREEEVRQLLIKHEADLLF